LYLSPQVLRHLRESELDPRQEVEEFEKKVPHFTPLRRDLLMYSMCKDLPYLDFRDMLSKQQRLEALLETITFDLETLAEFALQCECVGDYMVETALDLAQPLVDQYLKVHNALPQGYATLVIELLEYYGDTETRIAHLKVLLLDPTNFKRACKVIIETMSSEYSYEELFDIAKLQQPETSVLDFNPETLEILEKVLDRVEQRQDNYVPIPARNLLTWSLDLCTANTKRVTTGFRKLIECVNEACSRTPAVFLHVLAYLEGHESKVKMLDRAVSILGVNLPTLYRGWFFCHDYSKSEAHLVVFKGACFFTAGGGTIKF
jgi:hypothetical protein